jgi:hypothetical protein
MRENAVRGELCQAFRKLRRQDRDRRFGLEQQCHPALGHDAAADDEDGAPSKIREQG